MFITSQNEPGSFAGIYVGFVRKTDDPEERGRVRAYCPAVMGPVDDADHWLDWAEACFPWIGGLSSLDFGVPPLREDNDRESVCVWLMFQNGDPDFPVWMGTGVYAPTVDGLHSRAKVAEGSVAAGGALVDLAASGSVPGAEVTDFNPVKIEKGKQVVLFAKTGVDIVIMSNEGGAIVIGPNGVEIQALQVFINGQRVGEGSLADMVA